VPRRGLGEDAGDVCRPDGTAGTIDATGLGLTDLGQGPVNAVGLIREVPQMAVKPQPTSRIGGRIGDG